MVSACVCVWVQLNALGSRTSEPKNGRGSKRTKKHFVEANAPVVHDIKRKTRSHQFLPGVTSERNHMCFVALVSFDTFVGKI